MLRAIHEPNSNGSIVVLPNNVALAVAVEIASPRNVPRVGRRAEAGIGVLRNPIADEKAG